MPPERFFAICLLLAGAVPAAAQAPTPPGRLVDVGGYRVHLNCTGAGSPTVLVVGAGFSVDWTLVQSAAAKFTTICTYDPSGMAWSDPGPPFTCRGRVDEIHKLAGAGKIETPLVLVGLSIGACVARLYAAEHAAEVSGMVIVDHAFSPDPAPQPRISVKGADTAPVLIEQTPIEITVEDASQFSNLPVRARELHRWAASLHPKLPTWEMVEDCLAQLKVSAPGPFPLGNLPLVVVSTGNQARGYARLQSELLALSHRSSQMVADESFHAVEIDQPETVAAAIRKVVDAVRR